MMKQPARYVPLSLALAWGSAAIAQNPPSRLPPMVHFTAQEDHPNWPTFLTLASRYIKTPATHAASGSR